MVKATLLQLKRRGVELRLALSSAANPGRIDLTLLRAVARARRWSDDRMINLVQPDSVRLMSCAAGALISRHRLAKCASMDTRLSVTFADMFRGRDLFEQTFPGWLSA